MAEGEMRKARELVREILEEGLSVTVDNGEYVAVKRSTDRAEIERELGATDMETLILYRGDARVGSMLLVWGNDPDGSELVADYTDNAVIDALWRRVFWEEEGV